MIATVLAYVLNAAWEAPLAALGAGLLCRLARLRPQARYATCAAFLALAVLLPAAELRPGGVPAQPAATAWTGPAPPARPAWRLPFASRSVQASVPVGRTLAGLIAGAAGLALAVALVRLLSGVRAAQALVQRSRAFPLAPVVEARLDAFLAGTGLARPPVRSSRDVAGPAVVGWRAAVILVPEGFERLPQDQVCAALLHECAHVARRDYALNLGLELLSAPLIWHPAVHLLKARLGAAREAVCDGLAAAEMGSPVQYAERLVELARAVQRSEGRRTGAALALVGRGGLEARVGELLRARAGTRRAPVRTLAAGLAAGALVVLPTAMVHLSPAVERAGTTAPRLARQGAGWPASARTAPLQMARLDVARPLLQPSRRRAERRTGAVHSRSGRLQPYPPIPGRPVSGASPLEPPAPLDARLQVAEPARPAAILTAAAGEPPHEAVQAVLVMRSAPARITLSVAVLLAPPACAPGQLAEDTSDAASALAKPPGPEDRAPPSGVGLAASPPPSDPLAPPERGEPPARPVAACLKVPPPVVGARPAGVA